MLRGAGLPPPTWQHPGWAAERGFGRNRARSHREAAHGPTASSRLTQQCAGCQHGLVPLRLQGPPEQDILTHGAWSHGRGAGAYIFEGSGAIRLMLVACPSAECASCQAAPRLTQRTTRPSTPHKSPHMARPCPPDQHTAVPGPGLT